jgi:protein gp37
VGETSAIEWTDATWNPIRGCTRVSEGCRNCYAETLAARFSDPATEKGPAQWGHGLATRTSKGARWTGKIDVAADATFLAPLRWKRPRRIFVNSLSDLFHEAVPDAVIDRVFAVMALSPQHTFQLLTKRPERMLAYIEEWLYDHDSGRRAGIGELYTTLEPHPSVAHVVNRPRVLPLANIWLGVSVEDQAAADARIPLLLQTPAAKRFLSCEPLLGPVDLRWIAEPDEDKDGVIDALLGCNWIDGMGRGEAFHPVRPGHQGREMTRWVCSSEAEILDARKIDWVIAGGESGPGARPMHPEWVRGLRDQCAAAQVPFFFKQWGEWAPGDQVLPPPPWDWWRCWAEEPIPGPDGEEPYPMAFRCGKKRAGRTLDGVIHDGFPG